MVKFQCDTCSKWFKEHNNEVAILLLQTPHNGTHCPSCVSAKENKEREELEMRCFPIRVTFVAQVDPSLLKGYKREITNALSECLALAKLNQIVSKNSDIEFCYEGVIDTCPTDG